MRRVIRAQWRDAVVLFQETRASLLLFACLVPGSALLFYLFYTDPQTGERIGFAKALYGTFALLFFEDTLAFPTQWYLQLLYFMIPVVGLIAVVNGIINFGVALTNKHQRGQKWQIAMASTYQKHTLVCGIGKMGYRVTLELLKFNRDVVAIEINPQGRFVEKVKALGIPVIIADARVPENLLKAGVREADAIIPCTEDELTNLDISLDARELNPGIKIVMRLFDPDLAQRVEKGFGIHTSFSVSALAAPIFAAASMRVNVKSSFYLGDQQLNISEITIQPGSQIEGWSIGQLEQKLNLSVVGLIENDIPQLHPATDQLLGRGNKILVMASLDVLHTLHSLNNTSPNPNPNPVG